MNASDSKPVVGWFARYDPKIGETFIYRVEEGRPGACVWVRGTWLQYDPCKTPEEIEKASILLDGPPVDLVASAKALHRLADAAPIGDASDLAARVSLRRFARLVLEDV